MIYRRSHPVERGKAFLVSSVEDDIRRMSRRYQGSVLIASINGYMIRMGMLDFDGKGAVLCHEPLRSTYDYQHRGWFQSTIKDMLDEEKYSAS